MPDETRVKSRFAFTEMEKRNSKISFRNCEMIEGLQACARLAQDRHFEADASLGFESSVLSAHVRKAKGHRICQDSAMFFVNSDVSAMGVFDGFGLDGTFMSELAADSVIETLAGYGKALPSPPDAREVLLKAAMDAAMRMPRLSDDDDTDGGSTATLALILPDGRFSVASVADSALYVLSNTRVSRLFNYHLDFRGTPVQGTDVMSYYHSRNRVGKTLTALGLDSSCIEFTEGTLASGESLLLVTDGVTKSLGLQVEPGTMALSDNSGCDDLRSIVRGARTACEIAQSVLDTIMHRITPPPGRPVLLPAAPDSVLMPVDDDVTVVAYARG